VIQEVIQEEAIQEEVTTEGNQALQEPANRHNVAFAEEA
jgi:hypothetical protein